ncbi:uncharacterized protein LOC111388607 [Olea europaea var. sylvestris]|uniref:uncharacterized protein LOC111388607 n=1 Tax=Olea europaea var. sylvestris TaxID=158386 RepID=UPI000C1D1F15|nr:uncharacterized protein LOC111388607 [Olea europaea var. sylvestris]
MLLVQGGIEVDKEKIKAIKEWSTPKSITEVNGIGAVLMRDRRPIAYFSEKLSGTTFNYPTYDKEYAELLGFEYVKKMHAIDSAFFNIYKSCDKGAMDIFFRHDGYLFRANKLCVAKCSMRELLIREINSGDLMGHFGVKKTLEILDEHFY